MPSLSANYLNTRCNTVWLVFNPCYLTSD